MAVQFSGRATASGAERAFNDTLELAFRDPNVHVDVAFRVPEWERRRTDVVDLGTAEVMPTSRQ